MRLPDRVTGIGLCLLGIVLCAGNLWYAAVRSTIPLSLQGEVVRKQVKPEKHPGVDDVYLIELDRGQPHCVDRIVFEAVQPGDGIYKVAWQWEINVNNRQQPLQLSRDFFGLLWCMSVAVVIMLIMINTSVATPVKTA